MPWSESHAKRARGLRQAFCNVSVGCNVTSVMAGVNIEIRYRLIKANAVPSAMKLTARSSGTIYWLACYHAIPRSLEARMVTVGCDSDNVVIWKNDDVQFHRKGACSIQACMCEEWWIYQAWLALRGISDDASSWTVNDRITLGQAFDAAWIWALKEKTATSKKRSTNARPKM